MFSQDQQAKVRTRAFLNGDPRNSCRPLKSDYKVGSRNVDEPFSFKCFPNKNSNKNEEKRERRGRREGGRESGQLVWVTPQPVHRPQAEWIVCVTGGPHRVAARVTRSRRSEQGALPGWLAQRGLETELAGWAVSSLRPQASVFTFQPFGSIVSTAWVWEE